jgi:hypothetical protein
MPAMAHLVYKFEVLIRLYLLNSGLPIFFQNFGWSIFQSMVIQLRTGIGNTGGCRYTETITIQNKEGNRLFQQFGFNVPGGIFVVNLLTQNKKGAF